MSPGLVNTTIKSAAIVDLKEMLIENSRGNGHKYGEGYFIGDQAVIKKEIVQSTHPGTEATVFPEKEYYLTEEKILA